MSQESPGPKSPAGNQMLFDQEGDHSGLDDQSQSYIEEEQGRGSMKLQGFRNPYKAEVIAEAKKEDNPDLNNHEPRNTAKFGDTNPFAVPEQNNHLTNNLQDVRENLVENDLSRTQDMLGDITADDESLNQSAIRPAMNNPLGLNQSYVDNRSFDRSDLDVSRSKLNHSNISQIGKKPLGGGMGSQREGADAMHFNFDFNSNFGQQNMDLIVNEYGENILNDRTEDTVDLSHMSIPRFKDNFYQKDNSLYLNMTALNQSNISGINRSQNRTQDKGKSLNKSAIHAGNTSNNRGNQAPNPQNNDLGNLLGELYVNTEQNPETHLTQGKEDIHNKEANKSVHQIDQLQNMMPRETAAFGTEPFQNPEAALNKTAPETTNKSVSQVNKSQIDNQRNENKSIIEEAGQVVNKEHKPLNSSRGDTVEEDKPEPEGRGSNRDRFNLSHLGISEISIFEPYQDNDEFIGNVTANNVHTLLSTSLFKAGIADHDRRDRAENDGDVTLDFNQELYQEIKKSALRQPEVLDQQKINEVSLAREETQAEVSKELTHSQDNPESRVYNRTKSERSNTVPASELVNMSPGVNTTGGFAHQDNDSKISEEKDRNGNPSNPAVSKSFNDKGGNSFTHSPEPAALNKSANDIKPMYNKYSNPFMANKKPNEVDGMRLTVGNIQPSEPIADRNESNGETETAIPNKNQKEGQPNTFTGLNKSYDTAQGPSKQGEKVANINRSYNLLPASDENKEVYDRLSFNPFADLKTISLAQPDQQIKVKIESEDAQTNAPVNEQKEGGFNPFTGLNKSYDTTQAPSKQEEKLANVNKSYNLLPGSGENREAYDRLSFNPFADLKTMTITGTEQQSVEGKESIGETQADVFVKEQKGAQSNPFTGLNKSYDTAQAPSNQEEKLANVNKSYNLLPGSGENKEAFDRLSFNPFANFKNVPSAEPHVQAKNDSNAGNTTQENVNVDMDRFTFQRSPQDLKATQNLAGKPKVTGEDPKMARSFIQGSSNTGDNSFVQNDKLNKSLPYSSSNPFKSTSKRQDQQQEDKNQLYSQNNLFDNDKSVSELDVSRGPESNFKQFSNPLFNDKSVSELDVSQGPESNLKKFSNPLFNDRSVSELDVSQGPESNLKQFSNPLFNKSQDISRNFGDKSGIEQPVEADSNTSGLLDPQQDPQKVIGRVFEGFIIDDKKAGTDALSKSFDIKRHGDAAKEQTGSSAHNKSYIEALRVNESFNAQHTNKEVVENKPILEQATETGNNISDVQNLQTDLEKLDERALEGFTVDDKKAAAEGLSRSFDIKRHDNTSKEKVKSTAHNKSYIEAPRVNESFNAQHTDKEVVEDKPILEQATETGDNISDAQNLQAGLEKSGERALEGFTVDDKKAAAEGLSRSFDIKRHDDAIMEGAKSSAHNKSYIGAPRANESFTVQQNTSSALEEKATLGTTRRSRQ